MLALMLNVLFSGYGDMDYMNYTAAVNFLKQADPVLAGLIGRVGPCQLHQRQQTGDLLTCLCRTVIDQQLSTKAADTIYRRFLQLYPDQVSPSAQALLDMSDDRLRGAGISRRKVAYLKDLAQHVLTGLPELETLAEMDDEAIIKVLTQVKGIGVWSVQMLLIFRLQRLHVLAVEDMGLRSAMRRLYGLEQLPNQQQFKEIGARWWPYGAIASWYLWRSLDLKDP